MSLAFLTPNGRFIGRLQGPVHGNVLLRKVQYQIADDDDRSMHYARLFIAGKIQNYRTILQRFVRDNGGDDELDAVVKTLESSKRMAMHAGDSSRLA